jgi:hypothetical protein
VVSGADTWEGIEEYGKAKEPLLRSFLELPNGIPSHDAFRRVFVRLDPEAFQRSFFSWAESMKARAGAMEGVVRANAL